MFRPLVYVLQRTIGTGDLKVVGADGRVHEFGDRTGTPIIVRITDKRTEWRLALSPSLGIGEAYMDGRLILERHHLRLSRGSAGQRLKAAAAGLAACHGLRAEVTRRLQHYNPWDDQTNVAYHYDIDGSLYDLFLDHGQAIFLRVFRGRRCPWTTLRSPEAAHRIKLNLSDGMRVLDIGSGWGGLALYLAKTARVDVTGITLSEEQLKIAQERAQAEGLTNAVNFELCDYRDLKGKFDRIVSVGMFEHVGSAPTTGASSRVNNPCLPTKASPAPLDRPIRSADRDQSFHRQVYLPWGLHPVPERSRACGRA